MENANESANIEQVHPVLYLYVIFFFQLISTVFI